MRKMKLKVAASEPLQSSKGGRVSKHRAEYSHKIADQLREERRVQGERRNEEFAGLTTEEKLERLSSRPGESRRQVRKLTGRNVSAQEALRLIRQEHE